MSSNAVPEFNDAFYQNILEQAWQDQHDSGHDIGHITRVLKSARLIAAQHGGRLEVIIPAVWLHDIVNLPKDSPNRTMASRMAADKAIEILAQHHYPALYLEGIHHAIAAHSFSANIEATTLEAKIVQDADRLDGLGAIGIARCMAVNGALGRALFHPTDPLATNRTPDDTLYALDHFQVKLYRMAETLHTATARTMAQDRIAFMKTFAAEIAQSL
jgi:uncharacterized protein